MKSYLNVVRQMKNKWMKKAGILLAACVLPAGVGSVSASYTVSAAEETAMPEYITEAVDAPELPGVACIGQMKLDFAECYEVYFYENDYALIRIYDSGDFLLVPENMEALEGLDDNIVVLYQPLDRIYLQATSAMALFRGLDSLDNIKMAGTQANGWYIDETVEKMENGEILFAGKYSEPDYEMLVEEECDLALESTMLLHTPKVQEMIEMLGIPVMIERASYETHPLARTEWIKLYGAMMDKEQEAYDFFEEQKKVMNEMEGIEKTGKTVSFFYINSDGTLVVRKKSDYVASMIDIAGADYVYSDNWKDDDNGANVYLTMEEFYATALNADYLIYNATIADELGSVEELLAQSELFADFKAVKEGNVWTTDKRLFQSTDTVAQLITDIHNMLLDENLDQMTFIKKVN